MNRFTSWSHAYQPEHQVEPIPMAKFESMVDVKVGGTSSWKTRLESSSIIKRGWEGCLTIAQNGLITPKYNESCEQPQFGMCEYRGVCFLNYLILFLKKKL